MTTNPQLLYALLAMDAYHRGDEGGINSLTSQRLTQIDNTVRLAPNDSNAVGFSAQAYSHNGQLIIAYRGTDDGSVSPSFPFFDLIKLDNQHGYPLALGAATTPRT